VSSDIIKPNSVPFSMNLLFEKELGEAMSREGTSIVGSQLSSGNTCRGLYQHLDTTFANSRLFAVFAGKVHDLTGSDEITGLTAANKCHFTTFLNTTLLLNGAQARAYDNSSGWAASSSNLSVDEVPSGANFPIEWHDRIYAAVTDRLYYTSTPSSGVVTWTGSGSGSLQVEREDGGGTITGTSKVPGYLLIFKERSLKRWNFDSTFPDDLVNIGTQSHSSITSGRGKTFFFYGPHGFYETNGGFPIRISRPIQRFIDAIPSSFYKHVSGWCDGENINWSVGDLTINFGRGYTESHSNVVLRYNIDTKQWAPLKYAHEFRFFNQYISSTDVKTVGGDTDGYVYEIDTGNNDYNGQAITYILQSPEMDFGSRGINKTVSERIFAYSDQAQSAELQARLDYGEWSSIGNVKDISTDIKIKPLTAKVFEFRIVDSTTGEQVKLKGIDLPNVFLQE